MYYFTLNYYVIFDSLIRIIVKSGLPFLQ